MTTTYRIARSNISPDVAFAKPDSDIVQPATNEHGLTLERIKIKDLPRAKCPFSDEVFCVAKILDRVEDDAKNDFVLCTFEDYVFSPRVTIDATGSMCEPDHGDHEFNPQDNTT